MFMFQQMIISLCVFAPFKVKISLAKRTVLTEMKKGSHI